MSTLICTPLNLFPPPEPIYLKNMGQSIEICSLLPCTHLHALLAYKVHLCLVLGPFRKFLCGDYEKKARCELGHIISQSQVTMEKDDRILDLAIHYTLNKSYQVTEELTKYQKRAVRKGAATLLVEKGKVYEKSKKSEGDQLCSGAAENLESMPLSCQLWTLWCHKDTQMDHL